MANEVARGLRKRMTVAERVLWKELKTLKRNGFHFRRRVPIDGFIVDFACLSQRIVIEVDGTQHDGFEHPRKDTARDAHLTWQGFKTLRFWNYQVMREREGVMREIFAALGVVVTWE